MSDKSYLACWKKWNPKNEPSFINCLCLRILNCYKDFLIVVSLSFQGSIFVYLMKNHSFNDSLWKCVYMWYDHFNTVINEITLCSKVDWSTQICWKWFHSRFTNRHKKNEERNFWIHSLSHESLPVLADEVPRESTPDLVLRDVDYDVSGILFSDFSWIYWIL